MISIRNFAVLFCLFVSVVSADEFNMSIVHFTHDIYSINSSTALIVQVNGHIVATNLNEIIAPYPEHVALLVLQQSQCRVLFKKIKGNHIDYKMRCNGSLGPLLRSSALE